MWTKIIWDINSGRCPRCQGALPTGREFPAGSRITQCRSIPICGPCGSDEAYEKLDRARGLGNGLSPAGAWPLLVEEIEERRARYHSEMKLATLTLTGDGHGHGHVIIERTASRRSSTPATLADGRRTAQRRSRAANSPDARR
jgi:hypothetical protein